MRQFWLLLFIAPFLFLSCSEDNQTPESPADADDNFITSVVMTVASQSYTAEIIDNIITITVPYTVSLNHHRNRLQNPPDNLVQRNDIIHKQLQQLLQQYQ